MSNRRSKKKDPKGHRQLHRLKLPSDEIMRGVINLIFRQEKYLSRDLGRKINVRFVTQSTDEVQFKGNADAKNRVQEALEQLLNAFKRGIPFNQDLMSAIADDIEGVHTNDLQENSDEQQQDNQQNHFTPQPPESPSMSRTRKRKKQETRRLAEQAKKQSPANKATASSKTVIREPLERKLPVTRKKNAKAGAADPEYIMNQLFLPARKVSGKTINKFLEGHFPGIKIGYSKNVNVEDTDSITYIIKITGTNKAKIDKVYNLMETLVRDIGDIGKDAPYLNVMLSQRALMTNYITPTQKYNRAPSLLPKGDKITINSKEHQERVQEKLQKTLEKKQEARLTEQAQEAFAPKVNKTGPYHPMNPRQAALQQAFRNTNIDMIISTGFAGTGKTFGLVKNAVELVQERRYRKIWIMSPMEGADGKEMGAFKGGPEEKMMPYMAPLLQKLEESLGTTEFKKWIAQKRIEVKIPALMRGVEAENSILIADEAQNMSEKMIELILGRGGNNTLICFDGDPLQVDLSRKRPTSGILDVIETMEGDPQTAIIEFQLDDIVRHTRINRYYTAKAKKKGYDPENPKDIERMLRGEEPLEKPKDNVVQGQFPTPRTEHGLI